MKRRILVVDDDDDIRSLVSTILEDSGYLVSEAANASELKQAFQGKQPDVVLQDVQLPDASGLDLVPMTKQNWPDTEVIVLTGNATYDIAVEAVKRGAHDFQPKPFDQKTLLLKLEKALEHKHLSEQNSSLRSALSTMSGGTAPIFQSASMRNAVRLVEKVAPTDVSILIVGESGTGKEVMTDLIHSLSARSDGPLVKINCAALPRELIESELFGSVKGAFTGAHVDREGLFRQAEGGTLLLDEISEMPIDTQSKLLRVLQEKTFRPIGGGVTYKSDCRIVAATNRKSDEAIKEGKLREDLFYRISAITVDLAPLRERREDIVPLANSFLKKYAAQANRVISGFDREATDLLRRFDWPGNVRQLQNEIQRATLMADGDEVRAQDLSISNIRSDADDTDLTLLEGIEKNTIIQTLKETGGNKLETAKRLGIGRQTLYNKIKAYAIEV